MKKRETKKQEYRIVSEQKTRNKWKTHIYLLGLLTPKQALSALISEKRLCGGNSSVRNIKLVMVFERVVAR